MMLIDTHNKGSISIIDKQRSDEAKFQIASRGDPMFSKGIAFLYLFLNLLSEMADAQYQQMQNKSDITRKAQSMANRVDSQIANVAKDSESKEVLSDDVYQYMLDNNITVNGQSIKDYATQPDKEVTTIVPQQSMVRDGRLTKDMRWETLFVEKTETITYPEGQKSLVQGELKAVKAALETVSNQVSDYVSQSQLQLQKLMQTYNVTVSLINSMQT
ncbi:secretion protein EspA [Shewanella surugensis]|uniref:Secretion protein EspA n=1 Tax=Shewanella surugensis TaxID=212020 RepID=A0ABT0L7Q8_9GAMM|nr:secretion protein EspA [Shewanella surugensis]MCL1123701.1 secretion protein EspA [Shewanella surugensis]